MRAMTKSAVRLAREALAVGRRSLPPYACRRSRHEFTQAQLFAILVLRQFLRTDYRGITTLLAEWSDLRRVLGLRKVPHYSTLCYAARRLLVDAEKGAPFAAPSGASSPGLRTRGCSTRRRSRRSMPRDSRCGTSAPITAFAARRATRVGRTRADDGRKSRRRRIRTRI